MRIFEVPVEVRLYQLGVLQVAANTRGQAFQKARLGIDRGTITAGDAVLRDPVIEADSFEIVESDYEEEGP